MFTDSVCCNELMAHRGSCQCCLKCPNSSAYMLLFHIMSLLLQLFFQLYALFQNKKSLFGLDFIADYRTIASSITGEYRLHMLHTVYIAIGTMMRPHVACRASIGCLKPLLRGPGRYYRPQAADARMRGCACSATLLGSANARTGRRVCIHAQGA